jgi:hypothetical protein
MADKMILHNAPVSTTAAGCAAKTGANDVATRDAAAIEQGFRTYLAQGINSPPIVPPTVGHNGAIDPTHGRSVNRMLDCMGNVNGLDSGVVRELKGMYSDSVQIERTAHSLGVHSHK